MASNPEERPTRVGVLPERQCTNTDWHAPHEVPPFTLVMELREIGDKTGYTSCPGIQHPHINQLRELCSAASSEGNHIDGVSVVKVSRIRAILDGADGE